MRITCIFSCAGSISVGCVISFSISSCTGCIIGVYRTSTYSRVFKIGISQLETLGSLSCSISSSVLEVLSSKLTFTEEIMTRPITNIPKGLIEIPSGCGEQTSMHTITDTIAWIYLKETNQLTQDLQIELSRYVVLGQTDQRKKFLLNDGSFCSYERRTVGSTWLTAYVGWGFYLAKDLVTIDMFILRQGLGYLQAMQRPDEKSSNME